MSLKSWLINKLTGDKRYNRVKPVEEIDTMVTKQQISKEITKLQQLQLERLKQLRETKERQLEEQKIADLEAEMYEDEEEDTNSGNFEDEVMKALLLPMLQQKLNPSATLSTSQGNAQPTTVEYPSVSLTDEALRELKDKIPKNILDNLKTVSDETKKQLIRAQYPQLDEDTLNRAVVVING